MLFGARNPLASGSNEGPQFFLPPTSGTANGLPVFSWGNAAVQLAREGASWVTFGQPAIVTYAFRATGPLPSDVGGISGFSQFNAAQITAAEEALRFWSEVANITF